MTLKYLITAFVLCVLGHLLLKFIFRMRSEYVRGYLDQVLDDFNYVQYLINVEKDNYIKSVVQSTVLGSTISALINQKIDIVDIVTDSLPIKAVKAFFKYQMDDGILNLKKVADRLIELYVNGDSALKASSKWIYFSYILFIIGILFSYDALNEPMSTAHVWNKVASFSLYAGIVVYIIGVISAYTKFDDYKDELQNYAAMRKQLGNK